MESVDLKDYRENSLEDAKELFGLDLNLVKTGIYYMAETNIQANELLLIQVKDEKDLDAIKKNIELRLELQKEIFKGYLPKEYRILENAKIQIKGDMILFISDKESDKVVEAFEK